MGSKTSKLKRPSKTKRPTSVETKAAVVPQEIVDEILDHLSADSDSRSLQLCTLVSKSWIPSCRRHLFYTTHFTPKSMVKWIEAFPVPEDSPAHHVRDLRFSIGGHNSIPEKFFGYTPWFTNVERVILLGLGMFDFLEPFWTPLPQSTTSLTIGPDSIPTSFVQTLGITAQQSNFDNSLLFGSLVWVDKRVLFGIGAILKGGFGGQLRLFGGNASGGVVDTLLEVPTGLHFTEVQVRTRHECLLSTVMLAEACAKTLVKLAYTISFNCESCSFSRCNRF